ncbi:MAG: hypothetical protein ACREFJ_11250 [Acetobacteraceae bacterium]
MLALRQDIDAVLDAIGEKCGNQQTAGQINRLSMLKRAIDGRASIPLPCTRMRPFYARERREL